MEEELAVLMPLEEARTCAHVLTREHLNSVGAGSAQRG